jgi:hypothetical protein
MNHRQLLPIVVALGTFVGCRPTSFDRSLTDERWLAADQAFSADSTLQNDEHALYQAAILYGSPNLPTYDPERARALLRQLFARFPNTSNGPAAADRLAFLDEISRARRDAALHEADLRRRIAAMSAALPPLRRRLDSLDAENRDLHQQVVRLEADVRASEAQRRSLSLELERLKAIDLKPRPAPTPQRASGQRAPSPQARQH